jgi:hypothetical protein
MNGNIQRRVTVAINWAAARIASLDDRERYEDSFALTEEFREWILCMDQHPELMADQLLLVPDFNQLPGITSGENEPDGLLEI